MPPGRTDESESAPAGLPDLGLSLPYAEREKTVEFLARWLEAKAPTTLAAIRYPKAGDQRPGIFVPLGGTTIFCLEINGGDRDGHEYWRRSRGWRIQIRWHSLQQALNYLMRRDDISGLREAILSGEVLFDRAGIIPAFTANARAGVGFRMISSRELFHGRVDLADAVDSLSGLSARGGPVGPEEVRELLRKYVVITQIGVKVTGGETALLDLSEKIVVAGQSRLHFNAAIRDIQALAGKLLAMCGGRPPSEWYAPSSLVHLMPPRMPRPGEKTVAPKTPEPEVLACPQCFRLFVANDDPHLRVQGTDMIQVGAPTKTHLDGRPNGGSGAVGGGSK